MQAAAYTLLGLSILAVWLPPLRLWSMLVPTWPSLYLIAIACALAAQVLEWVALVPILALAALCWLACTTDRRVLALVSTACAVVLALAMALHVVPGFHNPRLYYGVRFSDDSTAFTSYLNFDKASAGLFLLAAFSRRISTRRDAGTTLARTAVASLSTACVVLAIAYLLGSIAFAPKLPPLWAAFLAANLLFTCVAEEAFFRGFLQERIAQLRGESIVLAVVAVVSSAALFGLVHLGAGPAQASLAGIAGLGYALAYQWTRRIEAAIAAHFVLNAAHFIFFTYPYIGN